MMHDLADLYVGPLADLSPPGFGAPPADALPAGELRDPRRLDEVLGVFGARYGHADRRALASLWSKWHFAALLAPALASRLLLGRELPLGLDETHLDLAAEGHTARLWLPHDGRPLAADAAAGGFDRLVDDHMAPLIEALAEVSGTAARVFWSNAGNHFDHFTVALAAHPLASPGDTAPGLALLARPHLSDGRRNPLHRPVRYLADGTRVRRLCCLRYRLEDMTLCADCPLACARGRRQAGRLSSARSG
jgi:ferric iron reductase protein FhuF